MELKKSDLLLVVRDIARTSGYGSWDEYAVKKFVEYIDSLENRIKDLERKINNEF